MKFTVDELKSLGAVPRVHGNGFLQLDVGRLQRLHIWGHPALPRQEVNTAIHDHRFSFTSKVIAGRLINARFNVVEIDRFPVLEATHIVHRPEVREGEDTILVSTDKEVRVSESSVRFIHVGDSYEMNFGEFHETFSEQLTVTYMTKTHVKDDHVPSVLVPVGAEPDNEFNRYSFGPSMLWGVVEDALRLIDA